MTMDRNDYWKEKTKGTDSEKIKRRIRGLTKEAKGLKMVLRSREHKTRLKQDGLI